MKITKYLCVLLFCGIFSSINLFGQADPTEFHRCYTTQMEEIRRQQNPKMETVDEFEEWMAKGVKALKAQQLDKGVDQTIIYRIPIIFHIIHRGEPVQGTPAGDLIPNNTNISAEHVYAQIEQLNFDFRNDPESIYFEAEHPDVADTRIEFCAALYDPDGNELDEPGINRVNAVTAGLGVGTYDFLVTFDALVKPATIFDPERYCNFWSADLAGGAILGYAQFPETNQGGMSDAAQSADTDGVVCLYSTIGGENKEAPNSPYELGRTGTHEIGHWLGLRHIWGDGACDVDDFVADTPNAADSNSGCANENSCDDSGNSHFGGADPRDQTENYMDYSADICFTMFTNGQSDRMRIVMGATNDAGIPGSPRRQTLHAASETLCSVAAPLISYAKSASSFVEGSDCTPDNIINVPIRIGLAPSEDAIVTASVTGGTADANDFEIINPEITFVKESDVTQLLQIRLTQDGNIESDETIELDITLTEANGGTGALAATGLTHTVTIINDDLPLSNAKDVSGVEIYADDFEDGDISDWIAGNGIALNWYVGEPDNGMPSTNVYVSAVPPLVAETATYSIISPGENMQISSPSFSTLGYTNVQLYFQYKCDGEADSTGDYDFGSVSYSTDGGLNYTTFGPILAGRPSTTPITIDLPAEAFDQADVRIAFHWENDEYNIDTEYDPPLIFDNVSVTGSIVNDPAEITVDVAKVADADVYAGETVNFYDDNNDIIATLINGAQDLGCTTIEVVEASNQDNNAMPNFGSASAAASKTYKVTVEQNETTADYRILLYYTDTELDAWKLGALPTLVTTDEFNVFKTTNVDISAAIPTDTDIDEAAPNNKTVYDLGDTDGQFFSGQFIGFSDTKTAYFGGGNVACLDSDLDGTSDCEDGCPNDGDKIEPGTCGCGVADTDTDEDGTADCVDNCPNDPLKIEPGDCGCDVADVDTDEDGTLDCNDGCPQDPDKIEAGDCGCGFADTDTDEDGTADCLDGCPQDPNKTEAGDCGCGFADVDTDEDGTADCLDGCPQDPNKTEAGDCGCGKLEADTDNDGTPDCIDGCPEDLLKTSPGDCGCGNPEILNCDPDCTVDADNDQTPNCQDGCPDDPAKTDPGQCGCDEVETDTDEDGTADCVDNCPNDPLKTEPGTCGCGVADDADADEDGTADCVDNCPNDPLKIEPGECGCGVADADSDSDNVLDCNDGCPNDPDKTEAGACGCGEVDLDSDEDGTFDCNDGCINDPNKIAPGECGCGVADTDSDNDNTPDCIDGCPEDPDKTEAGACGCGVPDTDTDNDNVPDCLDECPNDSKKVLAGTCGCGVEEKDSDNDGLVDCNDGCPTDANKSAPGQCGCGNLDTDSDGDNIADCNDICPGSDDFADQDNDGIPDGCDSTNDALPLTLVNFTAKPTDGQIQLDWTTQSELALQGFEIQRTEVSAKGLYQAISYLDAQGSIRNGGSYQELDANVIPGVAYFYRLKMLDVDGEFAYSPIVSAQVEKGDVFDVSVQPNPATDKIQIAVINASRPNLDLTILTLDGKVLKQQTLYLDRFNRFDVNINDLPEGIYMIKTTNGVDSKVQKLVIF